MPAPTVAVVGMRALRRDVDKMTSQGGALNKALAQAGLIAVQPVAEVRPADRQADEPIPFVERHRVAEEAMTRG